MPLDIKGCNVSSILSNKEEIRFNNLSRMERHSMDRLTSVAFRIAQNIDLITAGGRPISTNIQGAGAKAGAERLGSMAQFAPLHPRTTLVVEDDAIVQMELVDWLTEHGLTVLTACNADEAIAVLSTHSEIDLLVTDIEMSGSMDGIRLAHYVADRWPPVAIIVISARLSTTLSELPRDSVFIAKPYQPHDLWRALTR
jgi:CheY-like chemotaxis protein